MFEDGANARAKSTFHHFIKAQDTDVVSSMKIGDRNSCQMNQSTATAQRLIGQFFSCSKAVKYCFLAAIP